MFSQKIFGRNTIHGCKGHSVLHWTTCYITISQPLLYISCYVTLFSFFGFTSRPELQGLSLGISTLISQVFGEMRYYPVGYSAICIQQTLTCVPFVPGTRWVLVFLPGQQMRTCKWTVARTVAVWLWMLWPLSFDNDWLDFAHSFPASFQSLASASSLSLSLFFWLSYHFLCSNYLSWTFTSIFDCTSFKVKTVILGCYSMQPGFYQRLVLLLVIFHTLLALGPDCQYYDKI